MRIPMQAFVRDFIKGSNIERFEFFDGFPVGQVSHRVLRLFVSESISYTLTEISYEEEELYFQF